MGKSANLPAPYGGQDTKTPIAVLKSPSCRTLYNFNTTESGISLRRGDSKWISKALNSAGGATGEQFKGFVPFGYSKMFMSVAVTPGLPNRYYDISTALAAPTLAYTSASGISGTIHKTYFNKRVFTFGTTSSAGDYYDGTTWGSWTYTMPATYNPIGGCGYKNRQYFIFRDTSSYGYSEIDAFTGAVTLVPLGGIISEEANLAVITPFTISNQTSSEKLLAFVFFSGEVLFYAGSYPNADDWGLVGTANISPPLNYNAVISPYQGDSLVATKTDLVSMRDLFLRGSEDAKNLSVSNDMSPTWIGLIEAMNTTFGNTAVLFSVSLCWWKNKNRIVVSFPFRDIGSFAVLGSTYFIYDTLRGAWTTHESEGAGFVPAIAPFKDQVLLATGNQASAGQPLMIQNKEGASDFQDIYLTDDGSKNSYDFDMLSAPIPFTKTSVTEAFGIEPILESDLYVETNWTYVSDFGKQVTDDQNITDIMDTGVSKPLVDTGIQNITYVQVRASGTTAAGKTVGINLYAYNVWYDKGEEGSR